MARKYVFVTIENTSGVVVIDRAGLVRQVLNSFNQPIASPLKQIVQKTAQEVRVMTEDPMENEVVLQIREGHAQALPPTGAKDKPAPRKKLSHAEPLPKPSARSDHRQA